MSSTIHFISGHLDLTPDEFEAHYVPRLREAVAAGAAFVVGDAAGTDALAQAYLHQSRVAEVTVYHMLVAPRHNVGGFKTKGGYASDRTRDKAMTAASDVDLAWVRPGREKSGTAKNLARRSAAKPR